MVDQAMIAAVMTQYPDVDRMMAETLVMMHEQGKLMPLLRADESEQAKVVAEVNMGKIEVAQDKEKTTVRSIQQWSEDKCLDSSS